MTGAPTSAATDRGMRWERAKPFLNSWMGGGRRVDLTPHSDFGSVETDHVNSGDTTDVGESTSAWPAHDDIPTTASFEPLIGSKMDWASTAAVTKCGHPGMNVCFYTCRL